MKNRYSLLIFLITTLRATDDIESWSSVSLEFKAPYISKLKIEQSIRFENQARDFKQTFTEFSFYYKVNNFITLNIPYRYAIFEDKIKKRLGLGSAFRYRIKNLSFRQRFKFQDSKEVKEKKSKIEQTIRNKLSVNYKLSKKTRPFISYEVFNNYKEKIEACNEDRFSIGLSLDIFKKKTLKISYVYKREDLLKKHAEYFGVFALDFGIQI